MRRQFTHCLCDTVFTDGSHYKTLLAVGPSLHSPKQKEKTKQNKNKNQIMTLSIPTVVHVV